MATKKRTPVIRPGKTRSTEDFPDLVKAQDALRGHMDDAAKFTNAYAKLGLKLRDYQGKNGDSFDLSADVPGFEQDTVEHDLKAKMAEARKRQHDSNHRVKAQRERVEDPLIDAILSVAVTATDLPGDRTDAEVRRRVLAALLRIERRAPGGLRLLL